VFIEDLDNVLSCQTHYVKQALNSKLASSRILAESDLVASFKLGDIVYKRNPRLNKCLDASWDGPYVVHQLLPPVNCSISPQNRRSKPKVVHLSQLKKAQPVYRTLCS